MTSPHLLTKNQKSCLSWKEIILLINKSSWPFEIEDENQFEQHTLFGISCGGLPPNTKIKVRCTKNRINSNELCGQVVKHKLSNIKYALKHNDFLLCQGPCDSKKKGKAFRKTLAEIEKKLHEKRKGTWRIDPKYTLIKASGNNWFQHQCGNSVFRNFYKLIDYPLQNNLPRDTNLDCPYCSWSSARQCVNNDINQYAIYINVISQGRLELISKQFPSSDESLKFECQICGAPFIGSEDGIKKKVCCGCPKCTKEKIHSQRAWSYEEAKILVRRRGYELLNDPGDYISKTEMHSINGGNLRYSSIIDLLKEMPAATIVCQKVDPVNTLKNHGKPYSPEDEIQLKRLLAEKNYYYKEIAYLMGRTVGSIKIKTRHLGLRNDDRTHINRLFNVKDTAFQIINKESAFFAGLLAADGCFDRRTNRHQISIELKAIDEDLLLNFMRFIELKNDVKYRTMTNVNGRGVYAAISFSSEEIINDLNRNFHVNESKTFELSPPDFSNVEVSWAYAAGILAGDGHFKINWKKNEPKIHFISASNKSVDWLEKLFLKEIESVSKQTYEGKYSQHYTLTITGKKVIKIANILKNYDFGMERKWNILRKMVEMNIN
ncbi:LAGLIDADG family homing endonuclease [Thiomicrorhabdus sp. ZW0627]|uniref:LAGLIDADG family homing endonuclease n=1 Tax=Thiomicrorhabdus sp. ZW0627 TaxID=3039774 RepID=UPI0024368A9E|nr:LAGLIDADG family homing endonuclease [Thiomicrorhabdus sp. ZW0627]MDG6774607.1 LAGLIDADG family homing endonuclease [Thiomicrorhabdus sp. ZW0627]